MPKHLIAKAVNQLADLREPVQADKVLPRAEKVLKAVIAGDLVEANEILRPVAREFAGRHMESMNEAARIGVKLATEILKL